MAINRSFHLSVVRRPNDETGAYPSFSWPERVPREYPRAEGELLDPARQKHWVAAVEIGFDPEIDFSEAIQTVLELFARACRQIDIIRFSVAAGDTMRSQGPSSIEAGNLREDAAGDFQKRIVLKYAEMKAREGR